MIDTVELCEADQTLTQVAPGDEGEMNSEMGQDNPNTLDRGVTEGSPEKLRMDVWGLLRRKGGNQEEYSLVHRMDSYGQRDTYILGRSRSCDICVPHNQVSTSHCYIYCDYSEARLRVFVEDTSRGGTYINSSLTRLVKGERIELMTGDEVYLLHPRSDAAGQSCFMFINMRERYFLHLQRLKRTGREGMLPSSVRRPPREVGTKGCVLSSADKTALSVEPSPSSSSSFSASRPTATAATAAEGIEERNGVGFGAAPHVFTSTTSTVPVTVETTTAIAATAAAAAAAAAATRPSVATEGAPHPSSNGRSSRRSDSSDLRSSRSGNQPQRHTTPCSTDQPNPNGTPAAVLPRARADSSPPLLLTRHIEHDYIIGDQIGAGMCGTVHRCIHRSTLTTFAVKVIDTKKFALSPGLSTADLREEAEMMRSLDHPNIVRIFDTYEVGGVIFIVMELVSGGDLLDRVVEVGSYSEAAAREIIKRVLSAVHYLHTKKIIHRDLKPENILLVGPEDRLTDGPEGKPAASVENLDVKITDFGLAKRTNQDGLKTFCGTPQYFAPEVLKRKGTLKGVGRYGYSADMWSVGVIIYILLSGSFPFAEETLYDQIGTADYSLAGPEWASVSREAKHLIRSLLVVRPHERLKAHEALQHPWVTGQPLPLFLPQPPNPKTTSVPAAPVCKTRAPHNVQGTTAPSGPGRHAPVSVPLTSTSSLISSSASSSVRTNHPGRDTASHAGGNLTIAPLILAPPSNLFWTRRKSSVHDKRQEEGEGKGVPGSFGSYGVSAPGSTKSSSPPPPPPRVASPPPSSPTTTMASTWTKAQTLKQQQQQEEEEEEEEEQGKGVRRSSRSDRPKSPRSRSRPHARSVTSGLEEKDRKDKEKKELSDDGIEDYSSGSDSDRELCGGVLGHSRLSNSKRLAKRDATAHTRNVRDPKQGSIVEAFAAAAAAAVAAAAVEVEVGACAGSALGAKKEQENDTAEGDCLSSSPNENTRPNQPLQPTQTDGSFDPQTLPTTNRPTTLQGSPTQGNSSSKRTRDSSQMHGEADYVGSGPRRRLRVPMKTLAQLFRGAAANQRRQQQRSPKQT